MYAKKQKTTPAIPGGNRWKRGAAYVRTPEKAFDFIEKRCLFEKRKDRSQSAKGDHRLMEDNFRLKENIRKKDKILIVDDILTSGASMYGCYKLIKDKCRKVKCLTLAYSKYYLDNK